MLECQCQPSAPRQLCIFKTLFISGKYLTKEISKCFALQALQRYASDTFLLKPADLAQNVGPLATPSHKMGLFEVDVGSSNLLQSFHCTTHYITY